MPEVTDAPEKGWEMVPTWEQMDGRERDAWLAENVMGWDVDRSINTAWRVVLLNGDDSIQRLLSIGSPTSIQWSPTTRMDDAFEVQEWMAHFPLADGGKGLGLVFGGELLNVVRRDPDLPRELFASIFACANATPAQRAEAAYRAMQSARKEGWIEA